MRRLRGLYICWAHMEKDPFSHEVKKDAAVLVKDAEARKTLVKTALDLLNDEKRINELEINIKKLTMPDASERIAKECLALKQ